MATIEWVNKSLKSMQPNPFNILLLSEGFTAGEKNKFDSFTEDL